jgi:hypothetical protein
MFSIEKSMFPNVKMETMKAWEGLLANLAHHWAKGYQEVADAAASGIPGCPPFQVHQTSIQG